jgi:ribonuclease III
MERLEELWGGSMDEERLASLKELEERLGYRFNEMMWLDQALTHKSYIHQTNTLKNVSNEVLEFLGDAVLNLAVGHLLIQKFPEAQEGMLSRKRAHLVKQSSLASLSKELQLERYLLLGKGELQNGGMKKASILANAYEALIGAIYMDSGFSPTLEIISRHFESYLQSETAFPLFDDYKSQLQEYSQGTLGLSPQYRVVQESGPDHDKRFQASVIIGSEVKGMGCGKSKKEAEQEAAKNALEELQTADSSMPIEKSEI